MTEEKESPMIAIVLSYIGGILILLAGIMILAMGATFGYGYAMMGGMMYGYGSGLIGSVMSGIGIWSIICGVVIIVGAWMIGSNPVAAHTTWGALILALSALSYIGGGGFLFGGILGIIGGILAITWKPAQTAEAPKGPA
jgi:hypothetical protein